MRPQAVHDGSGKIHREERLMENLLMAGAGLALLGYLFYTLFRPDRF
jgi:K+-transporting ATPase KdpF subunit